jgi:hypothetical protein
MANGRTAGQHPQRAAHFVSKVGAARPSTWLSIELFGIRRILAAFARRFESATFLLFIAEGFYGVMTICKVSALKLVVAPVVKVSFRCM